MHPLLLLLLLSMITKSCLPDLGRGSDRMRQFDVSLVSKATCYVTWTRVMKHVWTDFECVTKFNL